MTGAQLAGRTRLDLPLMLGTIVIADPDRARVAGFFIHLVNGWGFALGYAAVLAATGEATWWAGAGDQLAEDRVTVDVREAQPDDTTTGVDQRLRAGVAQQPEVADGRRACGCHQRSTRCSRPGGGS